MPRPERPVDPLAGPVEQFAFDLRKLREKAGSPGYRELGRRAHYSATTLADAARGLKLPTLAVTLAFVRACGGDEIEWEQRWRELGELDGSEPTSAEAPYVGLSPFSEQDADRFFGRERLLAKLRDKLDHHRIVLVTGASGSGKSSLLRAGLLAGFDRPKQLITPGHHPLEARLDNVALLVVDQFEELFTLCEDPAERTAFIQRLLDRSETSRIVLGLRADFYGHCAHYPELADAIEDAQVLAGPMTTDELRAAITQPAIQAGCTLETALVARLIADATGEPGVLPHVSHALLETWRRRRGNTLTLTSYHESGGIPRAIAQTAEHAFTDLDPDQQRQARQVLLRLTSPGDGTEDTKRRVHRDELAAAPVVERLAAARLLTVDDDTVEISHEAVIRAWPRLREWISEDREGLRVHRRLTDAAADWESHGRDLGSLYRGVALSLATEWATRSPDALNQQEREFLDASIAAESKERSAARVRNRKLRRLVAMLTALLIVATTTTVMAYRAQQQASEQTLVALVRKTVAEAAAMQSSNPALAAQLRLAAYRLAPLPSARDSLLSTFATPYATRITAHTAATSEAQFAYGDKILATAGRDNIVILWDMTNRHRPAELGRLTGHTDYIHDLSFTRDGRILATSAMDGTARLWNIADPRAPREIAKVTGNTGAMQSVAFAQNDKVMITAGDDSLIRLWDVTTPERPRLLRTLEGHQDTVHGIGVNPDGRLLATASFDNTVRLWDISDPATARQLSVVAQADEDFQTVAFSPDGRRLATGNSDRTARLWDVSDPQQPKALSTMTGHVGMVHSLAFSPDGRTVVTSSDDKTNRLWDIRSPGSPTLIGRFGGHTDVLWSVAFSHDGTQIISSSDDRTIRIEELRELTVTPHRDNVWGLVYDPAGRFIATASEDGSVRLWRPDSRNVTEIGPLLTGSAPVDTVLLSPKGDLLLTGDDHFVNKLWDLSTVDKPVELSTLPRGNAPWAAGAAFNQDGTQLAMTDGDGLVRLFDISDRRAPRELDRTTIKAPESTMSMRFSGDTLVVAPGTKQVLLWDVSGGQKLHPLPAIEQQANVFDVDTFGSLLAMSGADNTATLWDLAVRDQPRKLSTMSGHIGAVARARFSNDGTRLATASYDATIKVWDLADVERPVETAMLSGHADRIWGVAFGPDGRTLASTGSDATLRVWDTDVERVAARVCELAWPSLSEADWNRYFPDVSFQPPC